MINFGHIGPAFTANDSGAIIRVDIVAWQNRNGIAYAKTETGNEYRQTSLESADDHLATFPTSPEPQTPLEWSALWSAMQANYNAKSGEWTETTEHMFHEMLNAVPPRATKRGAFLNGEEWTHDEDGNGIFSAFRELPGNRYAAKYMTLAEFKTV